VKVTFDESAETTEQITLNEMTSSDVSE